MMTATENHTAHNLNTIPAPLLGITGSVIAGTSNLSSTAAGNREQMMLENMPLVRYVARSIHAKLPQHVELEDLVSAGLLGLVDALSKFDSRKEVQFKSYAQFRIRGAILDSLRQVDWSSRELRRKGREIAEATQVLTARLGRNPSDLEVAAELGIGLKSLQQLAGELKGLEVTSLQAARADESGEEVVLHVPAPITDDPFFCFAETEQREQLAAAIEALPEKERLVLTLYYYEELTMKEIGLTLGVVESRVSQIRASAVAHLRSHMGVQKKTNASRRRATQVH